MAVTTLLPKRRFIKVLLFLPACLLLCVLMNAVFVGTWMYYGIHNKPVPSIENSPFLTTPLEHSELSGATVVPRTFVPPNQQKSSLAPIVIAHVVSLIKCKKSSSVTGFLDAAAVLRHSIHKQSIHSTTTNTSKYSYQMYAIVHKEQCAENAVLLEQLGYITLLRDTPIQLDEIEGDWYRNHVENENCCGSKEFIKLYSYTLQQHPIVVHWDMDVAIFKPMDDLFDAMIYDKDSPQGKAARSRLQVQHPSRALPNVIDAFFTRDITSSRPWEKVQAVQGGFLVHRPSDVDLNAYLAFIKEGNYTKGRCDTCGWAGLGYGGFQGAMAYQGVVAYFYDQLRPNTAVELNICKWNQVVADVIWRGPLAMEHHMQCREYPLDGKFETNTNCEDCRVTPIDQVNSAHYTACKKPWECTIPHPRQTKIVNDQYRLNHLTNITTCGILFSKWFELRQDFEDMLALETQLRPSRRDGKFEPAYFLGNCASSGNYIPMNPPPQGVDFKKLYGL